MASQMGLLLTIVIVTLMVKGSNAATTFKSFAIYTVGDDFGWNIPPNATFYSDWANSKTFQIGDQVVFNVTESNQSMSEALSLAEYNNCTHMGLVFRGRLVYTADLTSNGSRFFISAVHDHCKRGMKVIITVGSPTNSSSLGSGSPRILPSLSLGSLVATTLSTIVVLFFNYV